MLDSMRKLSSGLISKALMMLLVVSFAVWGVGDILRETGPSYAAKVGGETISLGEYQNQSALVSRQLEAMGINNTNKAALELTILRQLVQQKLNLLAMKDAGLFVTDELLGKLIGRMPEFQTGGKFDSKKFQAALQRERMPEPVFLSQIRKEVAGSFLADSLSMADATAPNSVQALESMANGETRDVVLLTIPARADAGNGDEAALKAYYEENKQTLYMQPERRTFEYVVLTAADIQKIAAGKPKDEALQELSNTIEDELAAGKKLGEAFSKAGITSTPRRLENITAETGKSFSSEVSHTVAQQGFNMSEGEISGLITTKDGTSLMVAVESIAPASPKPFEEVTADVRSRVGKQLARDAARTKALSVKTALGKSPNWQAVASEFGLGSRSVSALARPLEGKPAGSIPPALQQAVFERNVGEVAGPLAQENGDQLLAYITESHLPKVDVNATPSKKESETIRAKLSQEIENRAYQAFGKRHPVKINPAMMRASMQAEAAQ